MGDIEAKTLEILNTVLQQILLTRPLEIFSYLAPQIKNNKFRT